MLKTALYVFYVFLSNRLLQCLNDRIRNFHGTSLTPQVPSLDPRLAHPTNSLHQPISSRRLPKPPQHLRGAPKRPDGIREPLAGDIRGAPVDRLEQARELARRIQRARRRDANAPRQRGRQVRQDVAVEVRRDDGVDGLRAQHHPGRHGVHQHLVGPDVRVPGRQLREDAVPEPHAVPLRVALRHEGEVLPGPLGGGLEREPHHALDGRVREDRYLGRGRVGRVRVRDPALPGVFAFAVLAHDEQVEVGGRGGASLQGR